MQEGSLVTGLGVATEPMDRWCLWPDDARKKIEKAIKTLHDAKFVFGDLRAPNIIFSGGNPFLIDFD